MVNSDFEFLCKFDKHFACATRANYSPNILKKDSVVLNEIYRRVSGDEKSTFNPNCGGCVLNMLKRLSVYYYEEVEYRKAEQDKLSVKESNKTVKKQAGRGKRKTTSNIGEDSQ